MKTLGEKDMLKAMGMSILNLEIKDFKFVPFAVDKQGLYVFDNLGGLVNHNFSAGKIDVHRVYIDKDYVRPFGDYRSEIDIDIVDNPTISLIMDKEDKYLKGAIVFQSFVVKIIYNITTDMVVTTCPYITKINLIYQLDFDTSKEVWLEMNLHDWLFNTVVMSDEIKEVARDIFSQTFLQLLVAEKKVIDKAVINWGLSKGTKKHFIESFE